MTNQSKQKMRVFKSTVPSFLLGSAIAYAFSVHFLNFFHQSSLIKWILVSVLTLFFTTLVFKPIRYYLSGPVKNITAKQYLYSALITLFIFFVFALPLPPLQTVHTLSIVNSGTKNDLSTGQDLNVVAITLPDQTIVNLAQTIQKGAWEIYGQQGLTNQKNASLLYQAEFMGDARIRFRTGPKEGFASVLWDGQAQEIDFYQAQPGQRDVILSGSSWGKPRPVWLLFAVTLVLADLISLMCLSLLAVLWNNRFNQLRFTIPPGFSGLKSWLNNPLPAWCMWVGIFFLAGILFLPSGVESIFNGLPWSHPYEYVVLAIALPFLLILGNKFLAKRPPIFILGFLFILKLVLVFFAPQTGWEIKAYTTPDNMQAGIWQPTYNTITHPGFSDTLDRPFYDMRDFPFEWRNINGFEKTPVWIGLDVAGYIHLPPQTHLVIYAAHYDPTLTSFTAEDSRGKQWEIPVVDDLQKLQGAKMAFPDGPWLKVAGKGAFSGNFMALFPVLVTPDGAVVPVFGQNLIWQNQRGILLDPLLLSVLSWIVILVDNGLFLFLILWGIWVTLELISQKTIDFMLILLTIFGAVMPPVTKSLFSTSDFFRLGMVIILVGLGIGIYKLFQPLLDWENPQKLAKAILFVFGAIVLSFYARSLMSDAALYPSMFTTGNDNLTYQIYARQIFVEGDIWSSADRLLYNQPLIRYVAGLLHTLFGQSMAAQTTLEVWAILVAAMMIALVGRRFSASPLVIWYGAIIYLAICWLTDFNGLIGSGMVEYPAMGFTMLTIWMASENQTPTWKKFFPLCILASLGLLLRNDHGGLLVASSLLLVCPIQGGFIEAWKTFLKETLSKWKWIVLYVGAILLTILAQMIRNYFIGGVFTYSSQIHYVSGLIRTFTDRFYGPAHVLTAGILEGLINPGIIAVAVMICLSAFLAVLAMFLRHGILKNISPVWGLIFLGMVAPYTMVVPTATPPRWSIYVVPVAILFLIVFCSQVGQSFKTKRQEVKTLPKL